MAWVSRNVLHEQSKQSKNLRHNTWYENPRSKFAPDIVPEKRDWRDREQRTWEWILNWTKKFGRGESRLFLIACVYVCQERETTKRAPRRSCIPMSRLSMSRMSRVFRLSLWRRNIPEADTAISSLGWIHGILLNICFWLQMWVGVSVGNSSDWRFSYYLFGGMMQDRTWIHNVLSL